MSRRGLVVKALDSHARGCGLKSCLAQDKDYWWGKVTGAHLHKCAHSPGHCPLWLGNRLRSKSSMLQKNAIINVFRLTQPVFQVTPRRAENTHTIHAICTIGRETFFKNMTHKSCHVFDIRNVLSVFFP